MVPTEPTTQRLLAAAPHTPRRKFVVPLVWAAKAVSFHLWMVSRKSSL